MRKTPADVLGALSKNVKKINTFVLTNRDRVTIIMCEFCTPCGEGELGGESVYKIIYSMHTSDDGEAYGSYGIAADDREIADLSQDGAAVEKLVALCNRLAVPAACIEEIAEDFLAMP